ncbi:Swt1 family HEPN domain-containing protein [Rhodopila sp.]|uniref:Swt1 family HEPN domain-containing protein n=1 Tax=Rhodopila sp. TaxID=2480087 RepID=UPI002CFF67EB|nr:Swt1 family HEPN domain-containing protein [Rhodopila sp.]HVZ07207.1 Swt1 family HEPN domain-containing protein [Rhodopila sp.]
MSAEKETLRRVQDGLFHLQKGLAPFVEARMKDKHGTNWLHYASRAAGGSPNAKLDAYGLLKTMLDNWREVFDDAFGRTDKHKARNFTSMALEARNAISQLAIGLQDDDARAMWPEASGGDAARGVSDGPVCTGAARDHTHPYAMVRTGGAPGQRPRGWVPPRTPSCYARCVVAP